GPADWFGDLPDLRLCFALTCIIVVAQVVESVLVNLVRARQLTTLLMVYQVIKRYALLGLVIAGILLVARSLVSFYVAMVGTGVAAEGAATVLLAVPFFRSSAHPRPSSFSTPLYLELLRFGIPMMVGYELSGIILSVGDRYVIDGMIGKEPLGLYAAAYN